MRGQRPGRPGLGWGLDHQEPTEAATGQPGPASVTAELAQQDQGGFRTWRQGLETVRPRTGLERGSWRVTCLFVIRKASHDGGVHDAVQEHGEGVDGEAGVVQVLLHHAVYLVVRQLHGLDGVLQGADLHLRGGEDGMTSGQLPRPLSRQGLC